MTKAGLLLAASLAATTACAGDPPAPPPVDPGTVRIDWSIASRTRPADCDALGASSLRFTLYASDGALAGRWSHDCAAFSALVGGVAPDAYSALAELVDAQGNARTPPAVLPLVDVVGGELALVPVEFGAP